MLPPLDLSESDGPQVVVVEALEPERRRGIQRLGDRQRGVLRAVGLERRSNGS